MNNFKSVSASTVTLDDIISSARRKISGDPENDEFRLPPPIQIELREDDNLQVCKK